MRIKIKGIATSRDTGSFVKRVHTWNEQAFLQHTADADDEKA
jgi:hypothetical protein